MTTSPGSPASGATLPPTLRSDPIARVVERTSEAPQRRGNRLTLLRDGRETYNQWLAWIRHAERWVHFENYFSLADEVGQRFAGALSEKAREGVPVRVIYDRLGSKAVPQAFWDGMREAGVERSGRPTRRRCASSAATTARSWG